MADNPFWRDEIFPDWYMAERAWWANHTDSLDWTAFEVKIEIIIINFNLEVSKWQDTLVP